MLAVEAKLAAEDKTRLIETAKVLIFGGDLLGRVMEWLRKAAELSGYSALETIGRALVDVFVTPDQQERGRGELVDARQGKETANSEFPMVTKDGKR